MSSSFAEAVLTVSLDEAIALLTPSLRCPLKGPTAATQLLERLRLGLEDEQNTRKLVRALQRLMPHPPHPTVSEQLLEMLPLLEFPVPVVEELAPLLGLSGDGCNSGGGRGSSSGEAVGGGGDGGSTAAAAGAAAVQESKQLELVVDRYTEALSADSSLLLPILGSLFELSLTGKLAAKAAALACDAMSVGRLLFILYLKGLIQFRSPSFLSNMHASHTAISVQ